MDIIKIGEETNLIVAVADVCFWVSIWPERLESI